MKTSRLSVALGALGLLCGLAQGCAHKRAPEAGHAAQAEPSEPAQVTTRELVYRTEESTLKGFLAYPAGGDDKRPGVLVVHEWWGLNDYARSRARQLAELGYVALAVDMYGDGQSSDHPEEARKLMTAMMSNRDEAVRRFQAAEAALRSDPHVEPTKLAAIGYCMGGAVVLEMARKGEDLDAVASFHGNYATQSPLKQGVFPGKIFVAHGAADSFTPPAQLDAFKAELAESGVDYTFVSYEGAKHGFTNPAATAAGQRGGMDMAYDPVADAESWSKLQEILREAFAKP